VVAVVLTVENLQALEETVGLELLFFATQHLQNLVENLLLQLEDKYQL
jgi:hypothetical protein